MSLVTSTFFEVPASGWKRVDTTLGAMFAERQPPFDPWGYRVLPGYSLVRATFGSVEYRSYKRPFRWSVKPVDSSVT